MNLIYFSFICFFTFFCCDCKVQEQETVTMALLLRNKPHTLPLHLASIENQTWPKKQTYLYIHVDCKDIDVVKTVTDWTDVVKSDYLGIHFDYADEQEKANLYDRDEWDPIRLKTSGQISKKSVDWANDNKSHYFVVDCNHFIAPSTLETLVKTKLPIVAPLLRTGNNLFSNYHACIDQNGYFKDCPLYANLLAQEVRGLITVPVVNGTYFIRHAVLDKVSYDDNSDRYPYVIFSDVARKTGIRQYIDTRSTKGRITFAENAQALIGEPWINEFASCVSQVASINDQLGFLKNRDSSAVFTEIYDQKIWRIDKDGESTSGKGSTVEATISYRIMLQNFLKDHAIKSVVDLGCGLWEFSHLIDWQGIEYRGLEVVPSVVALNKSRYENDHIHFEEFDALKSELPQADLLICKDVLQHLTNQDVEKLIEMFKKYKYCLITNSLDPDEWLNQDIKRGEYRSLDLTKPPFNCKGNPILTYVVPKTGYRSRVLLIQHTKAPN